MGKKRQLRPERNSTGYFACLEGALLSIVEVYVKLVLSPETDIAKSKNVVEESRIFSKEETAHMSRRMAQRWSVPVTLDPVENALVRKLIFLGSTFENTVLCEASRQSSPLHLFERHHGRFHGIDVVTVRTIGRLA